MISQNASPSGQPDAGQVKPVRLILVGVGGYGRVHAERIAKLQADGVVHLAAAVDPILDVPPPTIAGTPMYPDLEQALASAGPVDVVVIAAPIAEHVRLAELALTGGADVLLEKPPVADFDDFTRLLEAERRTGRVIQVGFQSLGSDGLRLLREDALGIGPIVKVTATGAWSRTVGYWTRSSWAGRRSLHGQPVVDGVVTNPLAHATATALAVIGCREAGDVAAVDTDLYRANAIDSDDTSVVRIQTSHGDDRDLRLHPLRGGPAGSSRAHRRDPGTGGVLLHDGPVGHRGRRTDAHGHRLAGGPAREPDGVPPGRVGAARPALQHRRVHAGARCGRPRRGARRIDPRAITWSGEGQDRRPVVDDVEQALQRAVETGQTFTELGLPWAHRPSRHDPGHRAGGRDRRLRLPGRGRHHCDVHAAAVPASRPDPGRGRRVGHPPSRPRLAYRRRRGRSRCERDELLGWPDVRRGSRLHVAR